jgi:hypothetical protein
MAPTLELAVPDFGLIVGTRAVLAAGVALLVASKLSAESARRLRSRRCDRWRAACGAPGGTVSTAVSDSTTVSSASRGTRAKATTTARDRRHHIVAA